MSPASPAALPVRAVLLFDGECGLCNRIVRGLLRLDRRGRLSYAPLQSGPAQDFLRRRGLPMEEFESLVFVPDWEHRERAAFLQRTDGAIAALRVCGRVGQTLAAVLASVPRSWRDAGYRLIGRWRYRLFGPWKHRPLRRAEWEKRFLG